MTEHNLFNIDIERAVLGSAILDLTAWKEADDLQPQDFFIERHRIIWDIIQGLFQEKRPIDYLSVIEALKRAGKLEKVDGEKFILSLISNAPTPFYQKKHAAIIKDLSARRYVQELATKLVQAAHNQEEDFTATQAIIIDELSKGLKPAEGAVHISEWAQDAYSEIIHRLENGTEQHPTLKVGYPDIDRIVGGLDPLEGSMWLLGGNPGAGKTILFSNMAMKIQEKAPGVIYSLEMKRRRMMWRTFSALTGVSAWGMRAGKLETHQVDKVGDTLQDFEKMRLFVSDNSSWNTSTLRADLTRLKHEYGIKWYGVDYMGLLTDEKPGVKEFERLRLISSRLLRINRDLGLASIIIHTMTKEGFRNGNQAGFSGASGVQYDTDIAAVLEDAQEQSGIYKVHNLRFVKNRDGELALGQIKLNKYTDRPLFVTPEKVKFSDNGREAVYRG